MVYPPEGYVLAVRESTFVFGNVGNGDATLTINGAPVTVNPNGSFMAFLPVPADTAYTLRASLPTGEAATAVRRVRFPVRGGAPRPAATLDTVGYPRAMTLVNTNEYAESDTDKVTIARPTPGGTYKYFLLPGTVVEATARLGGSVRIRLDGQLDAWVDEAAVTPAESEVRVRRISAARAAVGAGYTDVVLSMDARAPFAVDQSDNGLTLTVYNARANLDIIRFDTNDPTVKLVRYEQVSNDRVRVAVDLRHPPVGYLVLWRAGSLVLRVRHAPVVDAAAPLKGRVIAVDAGHPPGGAMGPTRLREAEATLPIAMQLKELLETRGALVIMLRSTADAVALGARPIRARQENAEAFVSIHLNAFADGANPFAIARGSGTFFFHPQSEPLARAVQAGLVRHMGLRDEGIWFNNLAVARATWFPSVLAEGAWVVMPEQEAALRTAEFQRAYASGIVEGLEHYFADLAQARAHRP
jgi:N-acetylmuramoyl-L-alanine amidase